jgi:hypothetical protein
MNLNESIVEDAMRMVKSEIGRVKFRSPFPISLFNLHSSSPRTLATLRDTLLPKLLSGELSVVVLESRMETLP